MSSSNITREELDTLFTMHDEVTVSFFKKDGSRRVMRCTKTQIPPEHTPKGTMVKPPVGNIFTVFDLESQGWRSFDIEKVISVEALNAWPDSPVIESFPPMLYRPLQVSYSRVCGVTEAMAAMRLPKRSKSDTVDDVLGPRDAHLAGKLIRAGSDHAKAMRGVIAYLTLEMQVGWMIEFETYRHGVECLSTSSSMHMELVALQGAELANQKQKDLAEKVYTRILMISYQALRAMYRARRNHRHPDWQIFCDFVETLPYFNSLIMPTISKENKVERFLPEL